MLVKKTVLSLLVLCCFLACKKDTKTEQQTTAEINQKQEITVDILAKNLQIPWGIACLPNKDIIFCERPGKLSVIKHGEKQHQTIMVRSVWAYGEAGLLGLAVDPEYGSNHFIYIFECIDSSRVVRLRYINEEITEDKIIVKGIPAYTNHNGGALKFGPDGYLYIGTGDALKPGLAQDKNSLAGKILRVDRDGNAATGNPFNSKIWSYGHRNVQGFCWTNTGAMLATEHGPSGEFGWVAHDEINLIKPGQNYGWPIAYAGMESDTLTPALIHSGSETWAPSGCTWLGPGSIWPNCLVIATLRGSRLKRFYLNTDATAVNNCSDTLVNTFNRLRCIVEGPGYSLIFGSSNTGVINPPPAEDDKIYRLYIK